MASTPPSPTRIFVDTSVLFAAARLAFGPVQLIDPPAALVRQVAADIALKDAPIVAGAVHAAAAFLATYDRKHLLAQAAVIQDRFGITVGTPEVVLVAIE